VSLRNSEHSLKAALNAADDSANRASDRASNGTGSTVALSGTFFRTPDNALSLRHQRQRKNRRDTRSYHQTKSHVPISLEDRCPNNFGEQKTHIWDGRY
jgi:hypothetical protein